MVDAGRIAEGLARAQTIIGDKGESDARIGAHLGQLSRVWLGELRFRPRLKHVKQPSHDAAAARGDRCLGA